MRHLLLCLAVVVLGLVAFDRGRADACIRASEANKLIGWSADGRYALLARVEADGTMSHAEIQPTTYAGHAYVIWPEETRVIVTKTKVGKCVSFGDEEKAPIVEKKRGTLTEALLLELRTVKAMKFGRVEVAAAAAAATPTAAFTGATRYAAHELAITDGAATTTMPVPVFCVGSCLRDEKWKDWTATVTAVHTLASGTVLYETRLDDVCNGGTLIRLVAATPPAIKVPRLRCFGAQ
jgi:hypothetical protein